MNRALTQLRVQCIHDCFIEIKLSIFRNMYFYQSLVGSVMIDIELNREYYDSISATAIDKILKPFDAITILNQIKLTVKLVVYIKI
jgi:hypothetical protein